MENKLAIPESDFFFLFNNNESLIWISVES